MKNEKKTSAPEAEISVTLGKEASAEFEEKKSVFIGHAKPIRTEEEALAFIKEKKAEFADARHNVWAYRLRGDVVVRCSDDGEPQGSAGIPVLDALRKSGVSDAVLVVTRYFGGILLGAGGLVRAYSHAAKLAIDEAGIVTYEKYAILRMSCSYSDYQRYLAELPKFGARVDSTDFSDRVELSFSVKLTRKEDLTARIREMSGGAHTPEVVGERFDFG
ncbi:MAG: YigZ family protein [Ruminococcaceae bacterium]|nr:YigZ family protein [Oscillospiraceae bacterium]